MNKSELISALREKHLEFSSYIDALSAEDFTFSLNGEKWTAGHQLDHIYRSISPLNLAFGLPKFALKMKFGKAERPSDSYDEVVRKYREKLAEGGRASGRFLPEPVNFGEKEGLIAKLDGSVSKLCSQIEKYAENDLDVLVLPHPLLGNLTLREMFCFTIYHIGHHQNNSMQNLNGQ